MHSSFIFNLILSIFLQFNKANLTSFLNFFGFLFSLLMAIELILFHYFFIYKKINQSYENDFQLFILREEINPAIKGLKFHKGILEYDFGIEEKYEADKMPLKIQVNFHLIGMIKKVIFIGSVVFLNSYPQIILIIFGCFNSIFLLLCLIFRPYRTWV
jgi:hypothetical protein